MPLAQEVSVLIPTLTLLPIAAIITDINGVVRWANAHFTLITGYALGEIVGQHAGVLESGSPKHVLQETLKHVLATGEPWKGESLGRLKDGEVHNIERTITPIRDDSDIVTHALWTLQSIADRKYSHLEAQEGHSDFESLFTLLPDLACVASSDGIFKKVNSTWQEALGYPQEEVLETPFVGFLHPDDTAPNELGTGQRTLQFVNRYRHKDGSYRWLEWRATPPIGSSIVLTARDITERRRAEDALRQSNETLAKEKRRYYSLFNSIAEAVFICSLGDNGYPSNFTEVNEAACRYLGYAREELLRMGPFDLGASEDHSDVAIRLRRTLADGHHIGEETHIAKDGRRVPVEVYTHLVDLNGVRIISCVRDTSERKEAEKRYRDIFDGALEGIYRTSLDGCCLAANPALAKMLGYESAEEVRAEISDSALQVWVDPNERVRCTQLMEEQGSVRDFESQFKGKDGKAIWVSISGRKVCGLDGHTLYYDEFINETTQWRRMHDALVKSEEKFAKAFLCSPAITTLSNLDDGDRIIEVNTAFERLMGFPREEVIGRTSAELGLWVDPGEFSAAVEQFKADGKICDFEYHFRRKGGEVGVGLISAEPIELEGKVCVIAATIDVTQVRNAQENMKRLATAIDQTTETVVITDLDGVIQYCNPTFEKVTGYSKAEAIGQNPKMLKSGKHEPDFYSAMWDTITHGNVWSGHLINKRKDGTFYEEDATISPIRDSSGKLSGFVAVKRDVTQQRQLEDQLRQAQKLESIGRLAGGVAHDFNNLLTVINGYSGLLLRALKAGDPLRSYAEEISTAGDRAASLTKQLLAFSRKQVIEPEVVDLNAIIRESAAMLRRLIGDDIVLETHLDASLGQVMADPDQIHQVIMNLAVNARDAISDGGAIDVETLNVELIREDGADGHGDQLPGRYVLMTVTDTGHGIDEGIRKEIFDPFFTTKQVGKGTGLGLSTVYGIIRQNGGWIDVWSEVGVGTAFKIYLPRIDASPVAERKGMSTPSEGGCETILVVEDQKAVRSFAKAALRQHGYQVIEASDADEALSVAKQHSGQIHLLVTDVVMPGLNGRELSEHLRLLDPHLKVLFISGYTADVISQRGVLDPGVAFLHKPFGQKELAQKVREVLDGPTPIVGS